MEAATLANRENSELFIVTRDRSFLARVRLEGRIKNGKLGSRHLIEADTPLDGGVCLGGRPREAIVVDSRKYPAINKEYRIIRDKAFRHSVEQGCSMRETALGAIYAHSIGLFWNRDHKAKLELLQKYGVGPDKKVPLDIYINSNIAGCLEIALSFCVWTEKFIKEDILTGKISLERGTNQYDDGHAWARYTSGSDHNQVMIFDMIYDVRGKSLDELTVEDSPWDCRRDVEKKADEVRQVLKDYRRKLIKGGGNFSVLSSTDSNPTLDRIADSINRFVTVFRKGQLAELNHAYLTRTDPEKIFYDIMHERNNI